MLEISYASITYVIIRYLFIMLSFIRCYKCLANEKVFRNGHLVDLFALICCWLPYLCYVSSSMSWSLLVATLLGFSCLAKKGKMLCTLFQYQNYKSKFCTFTSFLQYCSHRMIFFIVQMEEPILQC